MLVTYWDTNYITVLTFFIQRLQTFFYIFVTFFNVFNVFILYERFYVYALNVERNITDSQSEKVPCLAFVQLITEVLNKI